MHQVAGMVPRGVAFAICLGLMAVTSYQSRKIGGDGHEPVVIKGQKVMLPAGTIAARCFSSDEDASNGVNPRNCRLSYDLTEDSTTTVPNIALLENGLHIIKVSIKDAKDQRLAARAVPHSIMFPALAGMLLLIVVGPWMLALRSSDGSNLGWKFLLSEKEGGLSLARVQLLLWWAPALLIVAGLAFAQRSLFGFPPSFAVLLGLSGATTALGAAASPRSAFDTTALRRLEPTPRFPEPEPVMDDDAVASPNRGAEARLTDLVTDWNDSGDFSRYQYLLLSIVGAGVILVAFLLDGAVVEVPSEFLALIGASQATYLGTKAVKAARQEE